MATVTEIYDFLRVLYARIGTVHCLKCGQPVKRDTVDAIVETLYTLPTKTKTWISFSWPLKKGTSTLKKAGFFRVIHRNKIMNLNEVKLEKRKQIDVLVDRMTLERDERERLVDSLEIALKIRQARGKPKEAKEAYLEELIVRRELSMNLVHYNPDYDSFKSLPDWAKVSLKTHRKDRREYLYARKQSEEGRTHAPYWNAAQREMVVTGKMHNYMRMYWGKKILEWSKTPEEAHRTALYLNNKYELDGRDPNGFAGVAWCFGKHDRAWKERPVFGKVRYMNAAGLRRKFNMEAYVKQVESL